MVKISGQADLIFSKIKKNFYLVFILSAAVVTRIYSLALNGIGYTIDSQNYIKQAKLLLEGH
ncbi:MAG: hypothetical protein P8Z35_26905, partial [Ignavibacteriaceae bacterium]